MPVQTIAQWTSPALISQRIYSIAAVRYALSATANAASLGTACTDIITLAALLKTQHRMSSLLGPQAQPANGVRDMARLTGMLHE